MEEESFVNTTQNTSTVDLADAQNTTFAIINTWVRVIFGLLILTWNIITLIVLWKTELKHEGLRVLFTSMALSDAIVGVICLSFNFLKFHRSLLTAGICFARFGLQYCVFIVSVGNVGLLAIDRCLTLCLPYNYLNLVTRRCGIIVSIILWISSSFASFMAYTRATKRFVVCRFAILAAYDEVLLIPVLMFCIVQVILIVTYTIIIYHVRVQLRKIAQEMPQVNLSIVVPETTTGQRGRNGLTFAPIRRPNLRLRYLKTVTLLLGLYLFCYLPLISWFIYFLAGRSDLKLNSVTAGLISLVMINSLFNPMLYTWKTHELQMTFLKLFCRRIKYGQAKLRHLQNTVN